MKCVAIRKCQVRIDGKIRTVNRGVVVDIDEPGVHFRPIEGAKSMPINFDNAQEQELLEADYNLDDLKEFILQKYDKKAGNRGKEKTVELLLDCRYRALSDADVEGIL